MSEDVKTTLEGLLARVPPERLSGISGVYAFAIGDEGWTARLSDGNASLEEGVDAAADCTVSASRETFDRLVTGELRPMTALFTGSLRITGDLSAAQRLQGLF